MERLFDADATINLRSLGVLPILIESDIALTWTSFVFENELSGLQKELHPLRHQGRLNVESVELRSPAHRVFKELRKSCDKGEAESIAWSRSTAEERGCRLFVSDDGGARSAAAGNPPSISTAECVALLVAMKIISEETARELLGVWDERAKHHGRPKGWTSFDSDFPGLVAGVEARFGSEIASGASP